MTKKLTQAERELLLAEYEPLRNEVNRTIDRMSTNEFACSAFVFSIVLFQLSTQNTTGVPDWIVGPFGAFLALMTAFFGYERSQVFRRHMDQVDGYLYDLESQFSDRFGWTNHYRKTMAASDSARHSGTRVVLWHTLRFVSFTNLIFQIYLAV